MRKFLLLIFGAMLLLSGFAEERQVKTCLEITSVPNGATVWVDYTNRGVTPLTLTDLPPGAHLLRVGAEGYRDVFKTVHLKLASVVRSSFQLERETGLLLLITEPKGCEVSENGISLGMTPLLVTTLPTGRHKLTVASPGFQTRELEVVLDGRIPLREQIVLLSDSGTLNLTSEPTGAEIFVNGISRGKTPCVADRIPVGEVTLEAKADGYRTISRAVSLGAGETQSIHLPLAPLPGALRIVTLPEKARVYINNEFKGFSPYDFIRAEPGEYRVRVDLQGYDSSARNITIEKGASTTEEFRLSKNTGRIEVITAPSRSTILVDGKKMGLTTSQKADTTAVSDPCALENISEGEHLVEVVRKGYAPQKRKVTVARGETLSLQFKLVRQFIPNYEVTTFRSYYKGVLEYKNEEAIRLELAPGVTQTIPMSDVKRHGYLREDTAK